MNRFRYSCGRRRSTLAVVLLFLLPGWFAAGAQTPTVSFSSSGDSVLENHGDESVRIDISPTTHPGFTLGYTVSGTAGAGDFSISGTSGSVTVPAGASTAEILIGISADVSPGATRTIILALSDGSGYTVGSPGAYTLTIEDEAVSLPAVSISGGASITEGGDATFTLTASPAPTANLPVTVTVSGNGDFAASGQTGPRTVTIPAGGTVDFTVTTLEDNVDESDGSIRATVSAGTGYTVNSSSASASVAVMDDDIAPTSVSISTGDSPFTTEGGDATFTLTASPAPTANLPVTVTVSENGDFAASGQTGPRTVTIDAGDTTATFTVGTDDDDTEESTGSIRATVGTGAGYAVGSPALASVVVLDNDRENTFPTVANAIPDRTATVGTAFSYTVPAGTFSDSDNDSLTYRASGLPGWLSFDSATRTFSGTPQVGDTGTATVTVTASDGNGGSVSDDFVITVRAPENDDVETTRPVVSISGGPPVTEGSDAIFTLKAAPAPTADLSVTVAVTETGSFVASGQAGSRTATILAGETTATLTVGTEDDDTDERNGLIQVRAQFNSGSGYTSSRDPVRARVLDNDDGPLDAGTPPTVDEGLSDQNAEVGTRFNYLFPENAFRDPDGDSLLYSATLGDGSPLPDWLQLAQNRGLAGFSGTPHADDVGTVTVRVTVDDLNDGQASDDFVITISAASQVPERERETVGIPVITIAAGHGDHDDDDHDDRDHQHGDRSARSPGSTDFPAARHPATAPDDPRTIAEGEHAGFILTATPPPTSEITVAVMISQTGSFAHSEDIGMKMVTIDSEGEVEIEVDTEDDSDMQAIGTITAMVREGSGYQVGGLSSATVRVLDNDTPSQGTLGIDAFQSGPGQRVNEGESGVIILDSTAIFTTPATIYYEVFEPFNVLYFQDQISARATRPDDISGLDGAVTMSGSSGTINFRTVDDDIHEGDELICIRLLRGNGYILSISSTGHCITIVDNDPPPSASSSGSGGGGGGTQPEISSVSSPDTPAVTIDGGPSVTEGVPAVFTVARDGDHSEELRVLLRISEETAGGQDFVEEGDAELMIPAGSASATLTVPTVDDALDEPDGAVTVEVRMSEEYDGTPSSTMQVKDNDLLAASFEPASSDHLENAGNLEIEVKLDQATHSALTLGYEVSGSATAGSDYSALTGTIPVPAGTTGVAIPITILDDGEVEGDETLILTLKDGDGYRAGDAGQHTLTITDDDEPAPAKRPVKAWLGRFGRTVATQVTEGITGRIGASRTRGLMGSLGGQSLSFAGGTGDMSRNFGSASERYGTAPSGAAGWRGMTRKDFLPGSSFSLTPGAEAAGDRGSFAVWGRAGLGHFEGEDDGFTLDGEVIGGMLGADYARGDWLFGLLVSHSEGEGDDLGPDGVTGTMESSLTAAIPYAAYRTGNWLTFWGAGGLGVGEMTHAVTGGKSLTTDTDWGMVAGGIRGDLFGAAGDSGEGPALSLVSDALWTRTGSDQTVDLAAAEADVTRVRFGLEGSWRLALGRGAIAPRVEVGARRDDGDAETGAGLEIGGGFAWSDPEIGLLLDVAGRALLAHGDDGIADRGFSASLVFDPAPSDARGPSFSLGQDWGGPASGGLDALLGPAVMPDRLHGRTWSRWKAKGAWGVPVFGGRFVGSPHLGLGLTALARDYDFGWRFILEGKENTRDLSFGLHATRRERLLLGVDHAAGVKLAASW